MSKGRSSGKPGISTRILHHDRKSGVAHGSLHKPIHNSVAFSYQRAEDLAAVFQNKAQGFAYGRQGNPTVAALEEKISLMEDATGTICFSTGMAAIAATMTALLRAGDHVIASAFLFGNTDSYFKTLAAQGIEFSFVDATEAENVAREVRPNSKMVFVETIANPCTQVVDLEAIGVLCRDNNLIYVVDNTLTTPYLFQPKSVGCSLSINALTKCIGGHGNVLGGAVSDSGLFDWQRFGNIYDTYKTGDPNTWGLRQIRKKGLRDTGGALGPESAHLLAMGAETLGLRLERSNNNALRLARWFDQHPAVRKVFYPGLPGHPQYERVNSLFSGPGSILSIELDPSIDCFAFLNALDIVVISSNLGDNRTLSIPVAHTIYFEMGPERRAQMGIADGLVRLSVGIEDYVDLEADFSRALNTVFTV